MNALTIKNFRCFSDVTSIPLRPLTLLVGENSTGKTSFLSAIRLAWDIAYSSRRIDFNEEPFLLGAFDQIANFRGGRAGRAESFELGFSTSTQKRHPKYSEPRTSAVVNHHAVFRREGSHPVISSQSVHRDPYSITVEFPKGEGPLKFAFRSDDHVLLKDKIDADLSRIAPEAPIDWAHVFFVAMRRMQDPHSASGFSEMGILGSMSRQTKSLLFDIRQRRSSRPVAIAPVRTRPQRTYNPVSDAPLPEGEHIPMVLAKTFFEDKKRWSSLQRSLEQFGKASGLFSGLQIKPLGDHESDPFQVQVKIEGPVSNLVDVGYGVSQALPILVDALIADRGDTYLLQQPEIHLHPRAQAELGTFLASTVAHQGIQYVVETHSDHLIDRIRMDIRDKKGLAPSEVVLLFFERNGLEVAVRPMTFDDDGNLLNAPDTYRQFFLEEEQRFFGVST